MHYSLLYYSTVMFTYSAKHNHNLFNILCRKSAGESDTAYTMGADTGERTIEEVLWRKAIGCKYSMMHLYYASGSQSVLCVMTRDKQCSGAGKCFKFSS